MPTERIDVPPHSCQYIVIRSTFGFQGLDVLLELQLFHVLLDGGEVDRHILKNDPLQHRFLQV